MEKHPKQIRHCMVYLWKSPLKYDMCTDEDDLSRYIGMYNREKGPDNALVNNGYMDAAHWDWSISDLEFRFRASALELLKYDILENDAGFIIVNNRVRSILENYAKNDLQFVPITIICTNGIIPGYFAVNILQRVSGIDKVRSNIDWSYDPKSIQGFGCGTGGLVYKPDCLGKHHIALEKEFTFIVISQELRDALCSMNPPIYEVDFVLPEDTQW